MKDKLLCPFCNKPLQPTLRQSDEYWCENYDCSGTNIEWVGSKKLWQELIKLMEENNRTRNALDVAVDALKEIDKTRSVANHKIGTQDKTLNSGIVFCWATPDEIHNTLEQITALEQKD